MGGCFKKMQITHLVLLNLKSSWNEPVAARFMKFVLFLQIFVLVNTKKVEESKLLLFLRAKNEINVWQAHSKFSYSGTLLLCSSQDWGKLMATGYSEGETSAISTYSDILQDMSQPRFNKRFCIATPDSLLNEWIHCLRPHRYNDFKLGFFQMQTFHPWFESGNMTFLCVL